MSDFESGGEPVIMADTRKNPYLIRPGHQPPKKGEPRWPLTVKEPKGGNKHGAK
jgi:hypothetical protein